MAKKISYNTKKPEELKAELAKLKETMRAQTIKSFQGKNTKEYRIARKNIARVLTAMNGDGAMIEENSTNIEK